MRGSRAQTVQVAQLMARAIYTVRFGQEKNARSKTLSEVAQLGVLGRPTLLAVAQL